MGSGFNPYVGTLNPSTECWIVESGVAVLCYPSRGLLGSREGAGRSRSVNNVDASMW